MKDSPGVPKFLTKIWALVEDSRNGDYICWSQDGNSFIVLDEETFAREILPRHFKHNNMASFVRQLNWYGFHKVLADETGATRHDKYCSGRYQHPYFKRGQEELLINIKRKVTGDKRAFRKTKISVPIIEDDKSAPTDMQKIMMVLHQLQARQDILDSTVESLKRENEALWKEVVQLRPVQPQFEPCETPHSYEQISSNQPLMIDSMGNYNQLSVGKSSVNSDQASENKSQWFTGRKSERGSRRTCREDLDSSIEDANNHLKISATQDYETYHSSDSDDPSDLSSCESELVINEDNSFNHGQSFTKSSGVSIVHHRKHGSHKRRKSSTGRHHVIKRKIIYHGSENEEEQKSFHMDSGHSNDKIVKGSRTHGLKMEHTLKQMHQDHTRLTEKVLAVEQQSLQKLSEISTALTTLTGFIMGTHNVQRASRLPFLDASQK